MRSLITTKKNRGPTLVPWGTPAKIGNQFDLSWPTLTRCWRFLRKAALQFNKMGGTLRSWSFTDKFVVVMQYDQRPSKNQ